MNVARLSQPHANAGGADTTPPAEGDSPGPRARVLIVDDSVVIRGAIARMLTADPQIEIVGRAANGKLAIDALARLSVDVVVLDIEMPVMDGMTALPLLLHADPSVRIIVASTLTQRGADIALRALRLGAADYLPKPSAGTIGGDQSFAVELIAKVKGLARLKRGLASGVIGRPPSQVAPALHARPTPIPPPLRAMPGAMPRLLALGSSTGGPQALFNVVEHLGRDVPVPIVLTQHMPPTFITILAAHLTRLGGPPCTEARDGEILQPGTIHLAPGDRHLLVRAERGRLWAALSDGPPENFCRPAVDPMLRSASAACDGAVLVVMLTGMGSDGLAGTAAVIAGGGGAIAQDEATSVVWGMPGAIARAGLCCAILPLPDIAPFVRRTLHLPPLAAPAPPG